MHEMKTKTSFLLKWLWASSVAFGTTEYSAIRLGNPSIGSGFLPEALGETGMVVGNVGIAGPAPTRPVYWNESGGAVILPLPLNASGGIAIGVASDGTIAGHLRFSGEDYGRPAVFEAGIWSVLSSDNAFGNVIDKHNGKFFGDVGVFPNVGQNAAIWTTTGYQEIPGLPRFISTIRDVNQNGVYTGITIDDTNPNDWVYGGFVGENGTASPLNYANFPETRGFEINDQGWITGIWSPNGSARRGYVARGTEIRDLGLFPGFSETWVPAINNNNTVVGGAANFGDFRKALVWPNGALTPQDLNLMVDLPGVTLIRGMDINDAGQILAEGRFATGGFGYFVLTPIPEPAMALGTASLVLLRRARRVRQKSIVA